MFSQLHGRLGCSRQMMAAWEEATELKKSPICKGDVIGGMESGVHGKSNSSRMRRERGFLSLRSIWADGRI